MLKTEDVVDNLQGVVATASEKKALNLVEDLRAKYETLQVQDELVVIINNEDLSEILKGLLNFKNHYPTGIQGNSENFKITFNKHQ